MSRGHFIGLNRHRVMLRDQIRMEQYRAAIEATIGPDDIVLDLGTGTGILAFWAARAGAKKVYACDPAPVVRLARKLAEHNGLGDVIEFIEGDSRAIDLPQKCTVLISECMGNFFFTDEMMPVMRDARRHMAEGARVIPTTFRLKVAPLSIPPLEDITFWDHAVPGFDLSPAADFATNSTYVRYVERGDVRGEPQELSAFHFFDAPDDLEARVRFEFTQRVAVNALVGWFDADLTDDIVLSTAPGQYTHWGQMIFPIAPLTLEPGSSLSARWRLEMSDTYSVRWRWSGEARDAAGAEIGSWSHDTDQRYPSAPT